jgi:Reverse transcriptase (RNA-dependent DNA polymerase)
MLTFTDDYTRKS